MNMNPLNRKLFQSREAREKLRQQGGIMASSPELAQTVAKFANGGPTELQIPRVRSAIQEGGMSYPSYMMLNRSQKRELGYPVSTIGGQLAFDRLGAGVGLVDPTDRFTPSGLNVSRRVPSPPESEEILTPEGRRRTRQIVVGNMPYLFDPETGRVFRVDGSAVTAEEQARVTELMAAPEVQDQINAPERATRQARETNVQRAQDAYDAATEGDLSGKSTAIGEASRALDEAQRRLNEPTAPAPIAAETEVVPLTDTGVQDTETPVSPGNMSEAIRLMTTDEAYSPAGAGGNDVPEGGDNGAGGNAGGGTLNPNDFDTTYDQMLSRLEGIMGKESDEDKKKKAMANLAMIGLAIASGQSPNALTNIAQGALAGMQGIQKAEAAEKASDRELRLTAMKMAADEVELSRRLKNAKDIAAMRASGGTGTYTLERLYQQNLDAILKNPDMFDVFTGDVVDPLKARQLAQQLSERGMSVGGTGGGSQFKPGDVAEQNGVTYEYQEDGTWKPMGD